MTKRAVFLDRDGVLNQVTFRDGRSFPPQTVAEFVILPGVEEGLRRLKAAGFLLVVVTNQPDVGNGLQRKEVVEEMHALLRSTLPLDEIFVCYHTDKDRCFCRKPEPGMLLSAAERSGIDLSTSFMVGDRWRDVGAGKRAGCRTFLVDYQYSEAIPDEPEWRVGSLLEASRVILAMP